MRDFSDFEIDSLGGEPDLLGSLRGEVVLVVNVASECGYTSQYKGLQDLHQDLHAEGFSVVGLPCNQFGAQEPGTNEEILEFATSTYDVTFPMFAKIEVNGDGAAPLYQWLRSEQPGEADTSDLAWNFTKFLVDRSGRAVVRFEPTVTPEEIAAQLGDYL